MSDHELLFRRNPVLEALRNQRRTIHKLWVVADQVKVKGIPPLLHQARKLGVPIVETTKHDLSQKVGDPSHQGVALEVGPYPYCEVDDILAVARERQEPPFLLLFDLLHGTQNIGMLLRTAELCGVHGVIVQDRRAPDITPYIVRHSAGASEHLHIAQVTNLVQTIKQLQEQGVWVVGMDIESDAQALPDVNLNLPLAIVVGNEGEGMRRLVRQSCDILLRLPMKGQVDSFNAAVAGSILMYLAWQARGYT